MKTYILLKDLPDCKAGAEFVLDELVPLFRNKESENAFKPQDVYNNTEWFKLKLPEEKNYTASDLEKAFNAAIERNEDVLGTHKYPHFKDYLKTLDA